MPTVCVIQRFTSLARLNVFSQSILFSLMGGISLQLHNVLQTLQKYVFLKDSPWNKKASMQNQQRIYSAQYVHKCRPLKVQNHTKFVMADFQRSILLPKRGVLTWREEKLGTFVLQFILQFREGSPEPINQLWNAECLYGTVQVRMLLMLRLYQTAVRVYPSV